MPLQSNQHVVSDFNAIFSTTSEKVGGAVSAVMISSPLWMQYVKSISDIAAEFAPILGCIYLSLQIGFKLWDRTRNDE
jgi:hypothetical protein